ncbi:NB-ARC domain-containing protein [Limnofasciculus baicalensis]|uniref:NB-ARC domain-containing protein n=1 Tax=Limnofasciculus baicalensis BBK-W-15 TaxID=2699891 RepID=A0AAE3GPD0_9CYAN|nr:NB-ARC domain-containing protein [Limnofasciculus baicalensis]MCP2727463.1 NB-ARC domain-containing protein [Limnofasciculus baicalensis BBK-W-15]
MNLKKMPVTMTKGVVQNAMASGEYDTGIEAKIQLLQIAIAPTKLTTVEELVLRYVLEGESYTEIALKLGYNYDYIKSIGSKLWQLLSKSLGEPITKRNLNSVIKQKLASVKIDKTPPKSQLNLPPKIQDWEESIDTSFCFGRIEEISILKQWIRQDKCRLVSILGMGGMGKTALTARTVEHLQGDFDYVIWRSVRHLPSLDELLTDILQVFFAARENDLADDTNSRINCLLAYLKNYRCLLIIDNYESFILSSKNIEHKFTSPPAPSLEGKGSQVPPFPSREEGLGGLSLSIGQYLPDYEEYSQLLRRIGEERHQSCLLLTSREKPTRLAAKEGEKLPIRSLNLKGLGVPEAQSIFQSIGLSLSESAGKQIVHRYSGNPLILKTAATVIRDLFERDVKEFLAQDTLIFSEIASLLNQQLDRLSSLEWQVMDRLIVYREGVSLEQLQNDLHHSVSKSQLIEALKALKWRSLLETAMSQYKLPHLVSKHLAKHSAR